AQQQAQAASSKAEPSEARAPEAQGASGNAGSRAASAAQADGASTNAASSEVRSPQADDGEGQLRASPMARRIARELGVDLATVKGSGPNGRIQKEDV